MLSFTSNLKVSDEIDPWWLLQVRFRQNAKVVNHHLQGAPTEATTNTDSKHKL